MDEQKLQALLEELAAAGESDEVLDEVARQWAQPSMPEGATEGMLPQSTTADTVPSEPKSVRGLMTNAVEDVKGIASTLNPTNWPGMVQRGAEMLGNAPGVVGSYLQNPTLPNPDEIVSGVGNAMYEHPVSSALMVAPTGAPGIVARGADMARRGAATAGRGLVKTATHPAVAGAYGLATGGIPGLVAGVAGGSVLQRAMKTLDRAFPEEVAGPATAASIPEGATGAARLLPASGPVVGGGNPFAVASPQPTSSPLRARASDPFNTMPAPSSPMPGMGAGSVPPAMGVPGGKLDMKALAAVGRPHLQDLQASGRMVEGMSGMNPNRGGVLSDATTMPKTVDSSLRELLQEGGGFYTPNRSSTANTPPRTASGGMDPRLPQELYEPGPRVTGMQPAPQGGFKPQYAPDAAPSTPPPIVSQIAQQIKGATPSPVEAQLRASLEAQAKAIPRATKSKAATFTANDVRHLQEAGFSLDDVENGVPAAIQALEAGRRSRSGTYHSNAQSDAKYRRMTEK